MTFKMHGYKEAKIEVREMTMGDLKLTIAQGLLSGNITDIEIRIVDCFMGEIFKYDNLNAYLLEDVAADWKVNVYEMCLMHDNEENRDYLKVIMADNIEMI